jgi:hypothetical protein
MGVATGADPRRWGGDLSICCERSRSELRRLRRRGNPNFRFRTLAKIWIALEKHGLSSPKMTIFSRGTKLEIEFLFESQRDESLVRAELPRAMGRKISARATAGKIKGLSAMVASEPEL